MRRRLEKRIYIPLPDLNARIDLFKLCLKDIPLSVDVDIEALASCSDGYSGADVHIVCREASMMPMRRLLSLISPIEIQNLRLSGELCIPKVNLFKRIEFIIYF
jgi:katanin p60 ATPase-containing subunit A1